jgi:hypothetical protein
MCLAGGDPGRPRRCSGDARAAYLSRESAVGGLEYTNDQLQEALAELHELVEVDDYVQCRECGHGLVPGDLAEDHGDHWICEFCVKPPQVRVVG